MNWLLKQQLTEAADKYETAEFISTDPISLPHLYSDRKDIEVSALISAWMAYGSRKIFLEKLYQLHSMMDAAGGPYRYITDNVYNSDVHNADECLYRFYKWKDFYNMCGRIHTVLDNRGSLECTVQELCLYFEGINGIPIQGSTSANKRLYMLFRWMVRKNSPVDFGIWNVMKPAQLIVPLDTHVYQMAHNLGLTSRTTADLKTAVEITEQMKEIWPEDPARGDFALYGLGVH